MSYKYRCLGTSQYLKEKFEMGCTLEAKINMLKQASFFVLIEQVTKQRATLVDHFSNRYVYNIPRDCIKSFAQLFEKLEKV